VKSVRDLHIYVDCDLVMTTHVKSTARAALRQLCQIRRSVPPGTFQSLVNVTLVLSRLHHGNAVLINLPVYLVRFESELNVAAWLIYHMRSMDHITEAFASLHWQHVPEWIEYKVPFYTGATQSCMLYEFLLLLSSRCCCSNCCNS